MRKSNVQSNVIYRGSDLQIERKRKTTIERKSREAEDREVAEQPRDIRDATLKSMIFVRARTRAGNLDLASLRISSKVLLGSHLASCTESRARAIALGSAVTLAWI